MRRTLHLLALVGALIGVAAILTTYANCVQPPKHPWDNPATIKYAIQHPQSYEAPDKIPLIPPGE